jgi:hypothetical protein
MGSESKGDVTGEKISPHFAEFAREFHVSRAKALYTSLTAKILKIVNSGNARRRFRFDHPTSP